MSFSIVSLVSLLLVMCDYRSVPYCAPGEQHCSGCVNGPIVCWSSPVQPNNCSSLPSTAYRVATLPTPNFTANVTCTGPVNLLAHPCTCRAVIGAWLGRGDNGGSASGLGTGCLMGRPHAPGDNALTCRDAVVCTYSALFVDGFDTGTIERWQ